MDKAGVAVGLATISIVGAALLFSAEHVREFYRTSFEHFAGWRRWFDLLLVALVAIVVLGASRLATK